MRPQTSISVIYSTSSLIWIKKIWKNQILKSYFEVPYVQKKFSIKYYTVQWFFQLKSRTSRSFFSSSFLCCVFWKAQLQDSISSSWSMSISACSADEHDLSKKNVLTFKKPETRFFATLASLRRSVSLCIEVTLVRLSTNTSLKGRLAKRSF